LTQPAHLAPARVWVGQPTQPSPPHTLPFPPRALWQNLNRRRRRPANPVISGSLRRRCLVPNRRPSSLYHLLQLESAGASSPGRSGVVSPRFPPPSIASDLGASPSLLFCACCATSGACDARVLAGGSAVVWCSRCVLGEVILGQPLAGRAGTALPCRPDEHLGDGECDFFPL
jgi:hypothetical protein